MDYALNLADRLAYSVLAVYTDTLPLFGDCGHRSRLFSAAMQESVAVFKEKADRKNIRFESRGETGKIGKVVKMICHTVKHIEFVILDQGIRKEEVASQSPVPVFSVIYTRSKAETIRRDNHFNPMKRGELPMSAASKKRHVRNCFIYGGLTAGMYAAVFTNSTVIMSFLTKGGLYALLPVAVVLAVSYAHGNFTNSFWAALGIEGAKVSSSKQAEVRQEEATRVRKDTRPRAEMSA
jgi:hypothetical protein